ncbi:hypothetical protein [Gaopeijia maritima]|uniref:Uncharacterized protein n=1 Tax=Gaopeijia maritima TaxID=3119007 RepID=A0ABU9ECF5_9BACT
MRQFGRISSDGFIDLRDPRRVRTPGAWENRADPMPEDQAVSFLLSHAFPGHRKVVRSLSESHRRRLRMASWADSVEGRMSLVDSVWRAITEPVLPPSGAEPELIQVIHYGDRDYPLYVQGNVTRVIPAGGVPAEVMATVPALDLEVC